MGGICVRAVCDGHPRGEMDVLRVGGCVDDRCCLHVAG